jgi:hypothetical protein
MDQQINFDLPLLKGRRHAPLYLLGALFALIFIVGAVYLFHRYTEGNFEGINSDQLVSCLERYGIKGDLSNVEFRTVGSVYSLCYNIVSTDLTAQEQMIINQNYVFQRSENIVLMIMVVLITLSGVALAALQLLAAYKLASLGKGTLAEGSEINVSVTNLAVKSSVVGVTILGISFAFFLVFVLYVYTIKNDRASNTVNRAAPPPTVNVPSAIQPSVPPSPSASAPAPPAANVPAVAPMVTHP